VLRSLTQGSSTKPRPHEPDTREADGSSADSATSTLGIWCVECHAEELTCAGCLLSRTGTTSAKRLLVLVVLVALANDAIHDPTLVVGDED
jgi:invasion protein IalB